jgi:hypothetical protein
MGVGSGVMDAWKIHPGLFHGLLQVYYVPDVLKKAGISNEGTQLLANMGVGFVKVRGGEKEGEVFLCGRLVVSALLR